MRAPLPRRFHAPGMDGSTPGTGQQSLSLPKHAAAGLNRSVGIAAAATAISLCLGAPTGVPGLGGTCWPQAGSSRPRSWR